MGIQFPPQSFFVRHKVFVSYYHQEDQAYKDYFVKTFSHRFINKSVGVGEINTDISTEYIKRLIREDYISDASVLIVLMGPNTWRRKHVDWEISAALNAKVGGCSGLMGIFLPSFPIQANGQWIGTIPWRLYDNVQSGYASLYTWNQVCANEISISNAVENAFRCRTTFTHRIRNNRIQMSRNE